MNDPVVAPHGAWPSPVTAAMIAQGRGMLSAARLDGGARIGSRNGPTEGGRIVLVRATPFAEPADVTPAGFNVRTKVHEYGGGVLLRAPRRSCLRELRRPAAVPPGPIAAEPVAITPDTGGRHRYADGRVTADGHWSCASASDTTGRRRRQRARRRSRLAGAPSRRDRGRSRLLRVAAAVARRIAAGLAHLGSAADAVGRHGAVGRPSSAGRHRRRRASGRRRCRASRSCSRRGARRRDCTSCQRSHRLVEPVSRRPGSGHVPLCAMEAEFGWPAVGVRLRDATRSSTTAGSRAPTHRARAGHLAVLDPGDRRAASTSTCRTPRSTCPYAGRRGIHAVVIGAAARVDPDGRGRGRLRRAVRRGAARGSATSTFDPGYLSEPRSIEFPTDGRPDRARVLLPAGQPATPSRRRASARRSW